MATSLWSNTWKEIPADAISEHQRERVRLALQSRVGILNGSPGTGKTHTAAQIVKHVSSRFGLGQIAVCSPTGKAAVRCTQAMRGHGLHLEATTVHRLLRIGKNGYGDGDWAFQMNAKNTLPFKFIVIDEASMLDSSITACLLSACAPGTHLLFVGDTAQLPPVGHGAPLRDLIAAKLPVGELTEIRRNSGMIVEACAAIKAGQPFEVTAKFEPPIRNLKHIEANTPEEAVTVLQAVLKAFAASGKFDPVWDCQVFVTVNAKSKVSRKALNAILQGEQNAAGHQVKPNPFRVGDKVICIKNSSLPAFELAPRSRAWSADRNAPVEYLPADLVDSYRTATGSGDDTFVANGEIGRVVAIGPRVAIMRFEAPLRHFKIPLGKVVKDRDGDDQEDDNGGGDSDRRSGTGCDFDLAYVITVHKGQGSEVPVAIIMIDDSPGAKRVASREHVYTAISRGKQLVITIGRMAALEGLCRRVSLERRKTFLREMVAERTCRSCCEDGTCEPPIKEPPIEEPAPAATDVADPFWFELVDEVAPVPSPPPAPAPLSFVGTIIAEMIASAECDRDLADASAELVRSHLAEEEDRRLERMLRDKTRELLRGGFVKATPVESRLEAARASI